LSFHKVKVSLFIPYIHSDKKTAIAFVNGG